MSDTEPTVMKPGEDPPSSGDVYRQRDNVVTREIAGETLLVPISGHLADMQQIFSLNSVGAWIWQRLEGGQGLEALLQEMLDTFDVSPERASADLNELLGELVARQLAEKGPNP